MGALGGIGSFLPLRARARITCMRATYTAKHSRSSQHSQHHANSTTWPPRSLPMRGRKGSPSEARIVRIGLFTTAARRRRRLNGGTDTGPHQRLALVVEEIVHALGEPDADPDHDVGLDRDV